MPDVHLHFDNPSAVYSPGNTITGRLQVTCKKSKPCSGIYVMFVGYGKVLWTEEEAEYDKRTYENSETYYSTSYCLWENEETERLSQGTHTFPFSFVIPRQAPGSFKLSIGKVSHYCEILFKKNDVWTAKAKQKYSVLHIYDLNKDEKAKLPFSYNKQLEVSRSHGPSGTLNLRLFIPRSGFVPGEKIRVRAGIFNMTKQKISGTKMVIEQYIEYYTENKTKSERRKAGLVRGPGIAAGEEYVWVGELTVPPLPPSYLASCSIMHFQYTLRFVASMKGFISRIVCSDSIVLGTIPLQEASRMDSQL